MPERGIIREHVPLDAAHHYVRVIEHSAYETLLTDLKSQVQVNKVLSDEVLIYMKERDDLRLWAKEQPDFLKNEIRLKNERDALKAAHEELLSYLPKVPTQPYEKELAQKLATARALLQDILNGKYRYYEQWEGDVRYPDYFEVIEKALSEISTDTTSHTVATNPSDSECATSHVGFFGEEGVRK